MHEETFKEKLASNTIISWTNYRQEVWNGINYLTIKSDHGEVLLLPF